MSLRDAIAHLANGTYTVTRTETGTVTNGRRTRGSSSTFPIVAMIEPIDGKALQDVSEGRWTDETVRIFTTTKLTAQDQKAVPPIDPDTVEYDGNAYQVMKVQRFASFGAVHYVAFAAKLEVG